MFRIKYIVVFIVAILLSGCNDKDDSFTEYLNKVNEPLKREYVSSFEKSLQTTENRDFFILTKNETGYFLDKSDYTKSYPDRKNYDIHLGSDDSTFLFDFEIFSFDKIDSITKANVEKYTKSNPTGDLGVLYDFFLPKNGDKDGNYRVGLKLIKTISDSHNSISSTPITFFIFKKDYDEYAPPSQN